MKKIKWFIEGVQVSEQAAEAQILINYEMIKNGHPANLRRVWSREV